MSAKRLFVTLHKYLGLSAGLLFALTALSGAVMVFEDRLERAFFPHRFELGQGPALPLQQVLDGLPPALAEQQIANIELPRQADQPLVLYFGDPDNWDRLYIDPASGRILDQRRDSSDPLGFIYVFHTTLLTGEPGHLFLGGVALAVLPLLVTGVIVWWPGRRRLSEGFKVRRRPPLRFWRELHKLAGILALPFLMLQVITGASLIFYPVTVSIVSAVTQSPGPQPGPTVTPAPGLSPLPLDTLLQAARRALPEATATWLHLPAQPTQPLLVRTKLPEETHRNGRSFVYLDPYRGDVLATLPASAASPTVRALNALYPLHTGDFGGLPLRWAALLAGLTGLLLGASGVWFWWLKRRLRAQKRADVEHPSSVHSRDAAQRNPG
jgi:uncharacterized iron-regulated membrane protein